jgi:hypothetical protein
MLGDDMHYGVADFAAGLEGKLFSCGNAFAGIRLIRHPRISTQHIDAGLPVGLPVISQGRHGVHPS